MTDPTTVLNTTLEGVHVAVTTVGESHVVRWTDGISEWEETYGSLSSALARVAVLAACAESAWEDAFVDTDEAAHVARWEAFLASAVA